MTCIRRLLILFILFTFIEAAFGNNVMAQEADISVFKDPFEVGAEQGKTISITTTVTNHGPDPTSSIIVREEYPFSFLGLLTAEPSAGRVIQVEPGILEWSISVLPPAGSASLSLAFIVLEERFGLNVGTRIGSIPLDPNQGNDVSETLISSAVGPPCISYIKGKVLDLCTGNRVSDAIVTAHAGGSPPTTCERPTKKTYLCVVSAGTYDITAVASGYYTKTRHATLGCEEIKTRLLELKPQLDANMDIDGDDCVGMAEAVLALQLFSKTSIEPGISGDVDIDSDGKFGMAEMLYILQRCAGLR
jgi:hypothetical protein